MTTTVRLDASNRIVLSRDLRLAAGVPRGQVLKASATPGRIVLEVEPTDHGRIVKRGRLKLWTGSVPPSPLAPRRRCRRDAALRAMTFLDTGVLVGAVLAKHPEHVACLESLQAPDLEIFTP